jgi:hypothetical protein
MKDYVGPVTTKNLTKQFWVANVTKDGDSPHTEWK